jgi:hypothetical protein
MIAPANIFFIPNPNFMGEQEASLLVRANDSIDKFTWGSCDVSPANAGDGGISKEMRPIGHTLTRLDVGCGISREIGHQAARHQHLFSQIYRNQTDLRVRSLQNVR